MQRPVKVFTHRGVLSGQAQIFTTASRQTIKRPTATPHMPSNHTVLSRQMRLFASEPPKIDPSPTSNTAATSAKKPNSLINRYQARLSRLSERTGVPLPSLGLSFLILHEFSAIVPIVAIYWIFAYLGIGAGFVRWIYDVSHDRDVDRTGNIDHRVSGTRGVQEESKWKAMVREWYEEGEKRVERVGKKYGILGYKKKDPQGQVEKDNVGNDQAALVRTDLSSESGAAGKVADAIAAYVVVKALLPLRIGFSIAAAPAFARYTLVPLQQLIRRFRGPA
ncbi:hypothetical protein IAT40_005001 [Kwoniella sp. CBS 6097]